MSVKQGSDKKECAWCKFMKGGPCRAVFETWQACVDSVADGPEGAADEEARKQAVEKCADVTGPLFKCLIQHPEYYGPQLDSMRQRDASKQEAATEPAADSNSNTSSSSSSSRQGTVASGAEPAGQSRSSTKLATAAV